MQKFSSELGSCPYPDAHPKIMGRSLNLWHLTGLAFLVEWQDWLQGLLVHAGVSWGWGRMGARCSLMTWAFYFALQIRRSFLLLTPDTFLHVFFSVLHFNHRVVTLKKQLILEFWAYVAHFKESEKKTCGGEAGGVCKKLFFFTK